VEILTTGWSKKKLGNFGSILGPKKKYFPKSFDFVWWGRV